MLREAQIPLLLWLPAAILFHALTGGSAHQAARIVEEREKIHAFSRDVREVIRDQLKTEIEIIAGPEDDQAKPPAPPPEAQQPAEKVPEEKAKPLPPPMVAKLRPKTPPKIIPPKAPPEKKEPPKVEKPKDEPKPEEKKPEEKIAENKPKKDKKKKEKEKKDEPQKVELPIPDGRIAVMNDPSIEKNQKDNPNANRIADEANTVKDESMARFRSYDQNASKPRGGGSESPPDLKEPGNSEENKGGFSNEVQGDGDPRPGSEAGPKDPSNEPIARSVDGANEPQPGQEGKAGQSEIKDQDEGKGEKSPDIVSGGGVASDDWSINPDGDGKKKQKRKKGRKGSAGQAYMPGSPGDPLKQYSINAFGMLEALGQPHMRREQEKARNTRIAKHRGSMKGNQFEKYRAAIENYNPTVKPGNQTSLNAARVPFASYINKMHNRIHPVFADGFLGSLNSLDPEDKLANGKLSTHLEIVLDGKTGAVVNAGVVRASGVTAFDVAALRAIYAAGPYGQPPEIIVSPDGNVYLHWEFYRDPYFACTSKFARPYLLKEAPAKEDGPGPRKPSRRSKERTARKEGKKKKQQ